MEEQEKPCSVPDAGAGIREGLCSHWADLDLAGSGLPPQKERAEGTSELGGLELSSLSSQGRRVFAHWRVAPWDPTGRPVATPDLILSLRGRGQGTGRARHVGRGLVEKVSPILAGQPPAWEWISHISPHPHPPEQVPKPGAQRMGGTSDPESPSPSSGQSP